jgi:hypothetical protein
MALYVAGMARGRMYYIKPAKAWEKGREINGTGRKSRYYIAVKKSKNLEYIIKKRTFLY